MGKVIGFHLIMTYYGFWLPNDPGGSGSWEVRAEHLKPFGPATHVDSQKSVARKPHDWKVRKLAKSALKFPPVLLNGIQARAVARGFAVHLKRRHLPCYACAVMKEHTHLVVPQPRYDIEEFMVDLKAAATHELLLERVHPFQNYADRDEKLPHLWGQDGRHVFLFNDDDMRGRIVYVEKNPPNAGMRKQKWSFVVPYQPVGSRRQRNSER